MCVWRASMMNSTRKQILSMLVVFLVLVSMAAQAHSYHWAHNYVYPTNYGYGVMERHSGVVRPYISPTAMPYSPYLYNYYGYYPTGMYSSYGYYNGAYNGYYNYNAYGSTQSRPTLAWVTTDNLNVRSEPEIYRRDRHANVIGSLRYAERVWVYGVTGDWYYIRSASNPNIYGYAHKGYLSLTGNQQSSYYVPPTYYLR